MSDATSNDVSWSDGGDGGAPILAGDWHDDDGQVIASLTREDAFPPEPKDLPRAEPVTLDAPKRINRLNTTSASPRASFGAVLLLAADPERVSLTLSVETVATNPATYLLFADDPGKVQGFESSAFRLYTGRSPFTIRDYTGPVWVRVPVGDGAQDYGVNVSAMAVSR